jgi:hypothetical protein
MSIKQNGGVFGRNPTFNDVTIDGTLTFNGDIDIDSDLKVSGNLDVTGTSNLASLNVTPGISSLSVVDAANSAVSYPVKVSHLPSGTTGNGLGVGIDFYLKNSTYSIEPQVATIEAVSVSEGEIANNLVFKTKWNATHADRLVLRGRGGVNGVVDLDLIYGNLKVADGFGIDFSLTSGTGTSELLDDYEEGTWTPSLGGTTTYLAQGGTYTKIGRVVNFHCVLYINAIGTGSVTNIGGLPFNALTSTGQGTVTLLSDCNTSITYLVGYVNNSQITLKGATTASATIADISVFKALTYIEIFGSYAA